MRAVRLLFLILLASSAAHAADSSCVTVAKLRAAGKATWRATSATQEAFLDGIFAMNPMTHAGLPNGDKAFIVTRDGAEISVIIWTDALEKFSCDVMPGMPKRLVEMVDKIKAGAGDDL
jgi:hypothetical protein